MTLLSELWETTRMRLLIEIDRHGSLSAAAQAVGIGQPSASQHLRTLETAAGQRLVERNGRGSRLTEGGRVLAAHAAQALAALAAGEQELGARARLQLARLRRARATRDRRPAAPSLGTRLDGSREEGRAGGPRRRPPILLRSRRGDRARRTGRLPPPRPPTADTRLPDRPARQP